MTKKDLQQSLPRFTQFLRRFGPLLEDDTRVARAEAYLRGLLLDADDHKNAETIALNAYGGDTAQVRMTPYFLNAIWTSPPGGNGGTGGRASATPARGGTDGDRGPGGSPCGTQDRALCCTINLVAEA